MKLNPYLGFDSNCREAFEYYAQVLGGTDLQVMTWADGPYAENMPEESRHLVMHAHIQIGDTVVMGSDSTPDNPYKEITGTNVVINVDDPAEAERIFKALSEGGDVRMPLDETFWAQRFAVFSDRFGVPWMVNCPKPE